MWLGGLDGYYNLCRSLRSFDELKFSYPGTAGNYDDIETEFPLNITKRNIGGGLCFMLENTNGESACVAITSIMEMLKYENLVIAAIKKFQEMSMEIEKKFNELVNKATNDLAGALLEVDKKGDHVLIEMITNFNDLFKICIDNMARNVEAATALNVQGKGSRKRANVSANSLKKKQAKLDEYHHTALYHTATTDKDNYAATINDVANGGGSESLNAISNGSIPLADDDENNIAAKVDDHTYAATNKSGTATDDDEIENSE